MPRKLAFQMDSTHGTGTGCTVSPCGQLPPNHVKTKQSSSASFRATWFLVRTSPILVGACPDHAREFFYTSQKKQTKSGKMPRFSACRHTNAKYVVQTVDGRGTYTHGSGDTTQHNPLDYHNPSANPSWWTPFLPALNICQQGVSQNVWPG